MVPAYVSPPFCQHLLTDLEESSGLKIRTTIEVNDSHSLILNASLGLGFGLLPNSWIKLLSPDNQLAIVSPPGRPTGTNIFAICKKSTSSELTANAFDIIKKLN